MRSAHLVAVGQVGNGARHFDGAVRTARGPAEARGGGFLKIRNRRGTDRCFALLTPYVERMSHLFRPPNQPRSYICKAKTSRS